MRVLIFFSLLFIHTQAFPQIKYGPSLGIGFSRQGFPVINKADPEAEFEQTRYIIVPVISFGVDVPLSKHFYLKTEIGFRQQGYSCVIQETRGSWGFNTIYVTNTFTTTLSYLEIPVNLSFKTPFLSNNAELLFGFTVGRFLGGSGSNEEQVKDWVDDGYRKYNYGIDVHAGNIPGDYQYYHPKRDGIYVKPYNINLNIGIGYQFTKSLNINCIFNYGLKNLQPYYFYESPSGYNHSENKAEYEKFRDRDGKVKTYSYTISLEYRFNGKSAKKK